jgi:hypothetical protein
MTPTSLKLADLRVMYEITRVFLHTEVEMEDKMFPNQILYLNDYDALWNFLRTISQLKDKEFPVRCRRQAWKAAKRASFQDGAVGVVLSGTLEFDTSSTGPPLRLRLKSMKLDRTHCIGRRLGNSRFLEIDMPGLLLSDSPKELPQQLRELTQKTIWKWFGASLDIDFSNTIGSHSSQRMCKSKGQIKATKSYLRVYIEPISLRSRGVA